jgi:hypothetical protein
MRMLRQTTLALAAVLTLAVVSAAMMSRQVGAQSGGPLVTIAGPLPVPVDTSSETVLVFDQTLEVSPGGPTGVRLGPFDVSSFSQVRIATRLESGSAADVTVTPLLLMGASVVQDVSVLAPTINPIGASAVVDIPGRSMVIAVRAVNTTTCQIQVYGRR